jgi:hypothetical protein
MNLNSVPFALMANVRITSLTVSLTELDGFSEVVSQHYFLEPLAR